MSRASRWATALWVQAGVGLVLGVFSTIFAVDAGGYFWPRWVWFAVALVLAVQLAVRTALPLPHWRTTGFAIHARLTVVALVMEFVIWALSGGGLLWPVWPCLAFVLALGVHASIVRTRPRSREAELAERVDVLTRTRRGVVDVQAAELKRIERDLHDGAQARMVSLAMNLGLAQELAGRDPDAVAELIAEARHSALTAADELRTVMRGIQPPVLSDRGLVGAVEALALELSVPTTVVATVPGRVATPVESAAYLAIAECLANVVKHSGANEAWVVIRHRDGVLSIVVGDDGTGGAAVGSGSGLPGIVRRLEVFDGTLDVSSPPGGPTEVSMEVPCELSSPRTSSCSATD